MENSKNSKIKKKFGAHTVSKLLKCVGEYKTPSILTSVYVVVEVILEVIIPLIMAQIINVGMADTTQFNFGLQFGTLYWQWFTLADRTLYIIVCGLIMVGMALLSLACGVMSGRYAAMASTGFASNVRQKLYYKVQNFSFANLDHFNTASMVTRLTTDISFIQMAYMMIIRMLVRSPVMLILALLMSISINAKLSLVFAVALPILIISLSIGIKFVYPRFMKMLNRYDDLNEVVQEDLVGIRTVKAFVREDHQIKKWKGVSGDVQKLQLNAEKLLVIAMPLMQVIIYACVIAIVWFGGNQIIVGDMLVGSLSAFLSYVMQILISLMMVAVVFVMIVMSRASMERVVEVFDEELDIVGKKDATDVKPADGSIDFENVDFSYSKNPEVLNLENIDLHIKSGETIGIIGATGSAKTTLIQLIPRFYDVLDGSVKVGGIDVKDYKLENLRGVIGMVLQKNVLFSGTIKENLKWGNPDASDEQVEHAAKAAQAHEFITLFPDGYNTMLGRGGVNVSGGQKQRLCIARALLKNPKIMILDDSTSAVDTATDKAIREGMKSEFKDTTVLIIAQRITSVSDADKIVVLNDGKINDVGTHDELLVRNEIYRDVFESQQKGADEND